MKKNVLNTCLSVAALLFAACGGVPQTFYYRIDYEVQNSKVGDAALPVTLGVTQFDADVLYQGDRLVYRNSPYEVQFYNYRRWIAPPRRIVTEKILKQFQASGLFQRVVRTPSSFKVDYVLSGRIRAFEEWDEAVAWYGIVTLDLQLKSASTHSIVWEQEYTQKTKAAQKDPLEIVRAISTSLRKVVQSGIQGVEQHLKASI
ncbi:MAG: ABC-type transport auxiliary lipoprotein family protein [bacterium]